MATVAAATRQRVLDRLKDTGDPAAKVALDLNLSLSTVSRVLREEKQEAEPKVASPARELRARRAPEVRRLVSAGTSPTQICSQLSLGYDTLKLIAAEHDITLPRGKAGAPSAYDQKIGRIRELADLGLSQSEISNRVSVPPATLSRWLNRAGITIERDPGRTRSPEQARNFGATPQEHAETSARGGRTGIGDCDISCLYCGTVFSRGRTGSGRTSRDRFCSREHAYAYRRENSGKTTTVTCACGCGERFLTWSARPKKYISREHWLKANRHVPEYGFDGHIIQGGHEAAFIGLCSLRGITFEFFDREDSVDWADSPDSAYGPDFVIQHHGAVYVDTKGWQQDPLKWAAFREQRGLLAILRKEDLDRLFLLPAAPAVLSAIKEIAMEQA